MAARMTVGRIANEGVTTERAILLRKEIVIHLRPAATLEIKTKMVRGVGRIQELARSEGRPAVGNHRRAKPRSRYQSMCMADVLSFAKVLAKVR
jgi:hypothetical protein